MSVCMHGCMYLCIHTFMYMNDSVHVPVHTGIHYVYMLYLMFMYTLEAASRRGELSRRPFSADGGGAHRPRGAASWLILL